MTANTRVPLTINRKSLVSTLATGVTAALLFGGCVVTEKKYNTCWCSNQPSKRG